MRRTLTIILLMSLLISCGTGNKTPATDPKPAPSQAQEVEEDLELVEEETTSTEEWSKDVCEANALEHPAGPGKVLVTKGNHNFTAYPYYFKGELLAQGTHEEFGNNPVWLIKNDAGYVMPVQMIGVGEDEAEIGDTVEIWGRLSGEGYSLPNVDNVVGETGYLLMIQFSVNGKPRI